MNKDQFNTSMDNWMDKQKKQASSIYPVEQKMVPFNGTEILGVKANDGKVYIGVRWICNGIGLTEDQARNERSRIQRDVVLQKGGRNLTLPTNGGNQDVLVIELEFLPLWLAKISITPNMQERQPEVADRLIEYQLKAKDVLAAAFLPQETYNPYAIEDAVIASMKGLKEVKAQIAETRQEVSEIKHVVDSEVWLTEIQKSEIKRLVMSRIAALRRMGYETAHYQGLYSALNTHFGVGKYDKIPRKDFAVASDFVRGWSPKREVARE
ncbi:ORF6C domain-containing protein [Paenibacillus profundus]|uniref:ORF6C domain-containing protein n=1 Tax=Paenibacillus profundus TaxID=1173085 RepID=A0ABS8YDQ0_9BACL|nr:phage antirepressor N-terminal domain-containing protein [Paenibacillus profundus]MCE5168501.1 ORF6C domain-containing protein [Paenibacillus profundus]